jgi:hypothetical protein
MRWSILRIAVLICSCLRIPLKVVSDSDLILVAGSDVKPVTVGVKRRWPSYGA